VKIGHLLCPSGVSGDLWLGALVDAGAPFDALRATVRTVAPGVELVASRIRVSGTVATKIDVHLPERSGRVETWPAARQLIDAAALPAAVATSARTCYRRLADAEAAAHGMHRDEVRFHELGSLDTVADIVGASAGVAALGLERITCGPVAVGGGTAATDHGTVAVPAPAVTELLSGFEIEGGRGHEELTTPTGAALLSTHATHVPTLPRMRLSATGRGVSDRGSVLTLLVGDANADPDARAVVVLEATVDDLSPELVPLVLDDLREAGAHDAWAVPVLMKKGRPGLTLTALAGEADLPRLRDVLFRCSTSLGVRWHRAEKQALERRWERVDVDGQEVRIKIAELDGAVVGAAPELEDVRVAATALARPPKDVHARATALAASFLTAREYRPESG
jgi:uncharacterized protein (TIGR00299 family) protein